MTQGRLTVVALLSALGAAAVVGLPIGAQNINVVTFDALAPTTTHGDVIFRNATTNTRLAAGTAGMFLQTLGGGADPQFAWSPAQYTVFAYSASWTNQPAASTELLGVGMLRSKGDLTSRKRVRVVVSTYVAAAAGADCKGQYSTDNSTFNDLTGEASIASPAVNASAWGDIPAGAQGDVYLRVVCKDGDAAADPGIGPTSIEVR